MSRLSIEEQFAEFEAATAPSFRSVGLSETISRVLRRRRRRQATLAVATVVVLALPLAWLNRSTSKPGPLVPPPAASIAMRNVPKPSQEFYRASPSVRFVDGTHGWAIFANCDQYHPIGCKIGLSSTSDSGLTWKPVPLSIDDAERVELYPLDRNNFTLLLQPRGTLLVTRDGGSHFASYPVAQAPADAQLAAGGRFQALCPGKSAFLEQNCPVKQIVRIGPGPAPTPPPWAGDAETSARVVNGADGRIWYLKYGTPNGSLLGLSTDSGKTWQNLSYIPEGTFTVSPDGKEAWVINQQVTWELKGTQWQFRLRPDASGNRYPFGGALGDRRLLTIQGEGAAYLKDGVAQPIPGIGPGEVTVLPDGSVVVAPFDYRDGSYLGVPTHNGHEWVLLR
jgi:hypothetical protein